MSSETTALVLHERIAQAILIIRGERVIIDADLAEFFGVATKAFNQAVKRNLARFPPDFMFQLTAGEKRELVTNCDHLAKLKFSPALPYAFTEHGAIMAASVLNSPRAVEMSVFVVRAFVRIRALLTSHKALAAQIAALEKKLVTHDKQIVAIVEAIKQLMLPPEKPRRPIGFASAIPRDERPKGRRR